MQSKWKLLSLFKALLFSLHDVRFFSTFVCVKMRSVRFSFTKFLENDRPTPTPGREYEATATANCHCTTDNTLPGRMRPQCDMMQARVIDCVRVCLIRCCIRILYGRSIVSGTVTYSGLVDAFVDINWCPEWLWISTVSSTAGSYDGSSLRLFITIVNS